MVWGKRTLECSLLIYWKWVHYIYLVLVRIYIYILKQLQLFDFLIYFCCNAQAYVCVCLLLHIHSYSPWGIHCTKDKNISRVWMVLKSITNRFCSWFFLILYTLSSKPMTIIPEQKCVETFYVCICICICFPFLWNVVFYFPMQYHKIVLVFRMEEFFHLKNVSFFACKYLLSLWWTIPWAPLSKKTDREWIFHREFGFTQLFAKFLIDSYTTKLAIYNNERFCKINNKHKFLKKKEKIISQTILYFT